MVKFSVFNELSLPFSTDQNIKDKFIDFFKLLRELKQRGLNSLRLSKEFKSYEILQGVGFQQFIGKQQDKEFKRRVISFLTNGVILIESPIIQESESEEKNAIIENEYFYQNQPNNSGLACCDIWNTLAISFNSCNQWGTHNIGLKKRTLLPNSTIKEQDIDVRHASKITHLSFHNDYFKDLKKEIKLDITPRTFWASKDTLFPNIVVFCPEIEAQIINLDKSVFQQAISILRDVETQKKCITDFSHSGESKTIHNNPKLKDMRMFSLNDRKTFFERHIKSLPNNYRMYFLEHDGKVHIGYIGKHLPTE